jgi:hypothetical protein
MGFVEVKVVVACQHWGLVHATSYFLDRFTVVKQHAALSTCVRLNCGK